MDNEKDLLSEVRNYTKMCFLAAFFISTPLYADEGNPPPPMPLEMQEKMATVQNAIGALDTYKQQIEQFTIQKTNDCMKAIGNPAFCRCIADKSPGNIDFAGYVSILTASKEKIDYDHLTSQNKKVVDIARQARDECVMVNSQQQK